MMTTSSTQPKWPLIGVRVCAIYLACITASGILAPPPFTAEYQGVEYLIAAGYFFLAFELWRLRRWALQLIRFLLIVQFIICVDALMSKALSATSLLWLTLFGLFALAALIYLFRPSVRALFQNQQSKIQNQKSPNA
jgi:hypothetical protein